MKKCNILSGVLFCIFSFFTVFSIFSNNQKFVVFCNDLSYDPDLRRLFLELKDAEKRYGQSDNAYSNLYTKIRKKYFLTATKVASSLGAYAVLPFNSSYYNDSIFVIEKKYDITEQIFEQLNDEYLDRISSIKNKKYDSPQNMLYEGIVHDLPDLIEKAIILGANINVSKNGMTSLCRALIFKSPKSVKCLLKFNANIDQTLIEKAVKLEDIKSAFLIAKRYWVGTDPLYWIDNIYSLVIGIKGTLLEHAIFKKDFETALLLIKDGANIPNKINHTGQTFKDHILQSINEKSIDIILKIVKESIKRGHSINDFWFIGDGHNGMSSQIYSSNKFIKFLLKNGANPNYIFKSDGWGGSVLTPLIGAMMTGKKDTVELLLNNGADINQQANPYNRGFKTSLAIALEDPNISWKNDVIDVLLKHEVCQ